MLHRHDREKGSSHDARAAAGKRTSAPPARSFLWPAGFPGRSISPESEDKIQKESQDGKQDDEEHIGGVHCVFVDETERETDEARRVWVDRHGENRQHKDKISEIRARTKR